MQEILRFYEEVAEMDLADLLECDFCRERERNGERKREVIHKIEHTTFPPFYTSSSHYMYLTCLAFDFFFPRWLIIIRYCCLCVIGLSFVSLLLLSLSLLDWASGSWTG